MSRFIYAVCEHCKEKQRVPERLQGRTVNCKNCGENYNVVKGNLGNTQRLNRSAISKRNNNTQRLNRSTISKRNNNTQRLNRSTISKRNNTQKTNSSTQRTSAKKPSAQSITKKTGTTQRINSSSLRQNRSTQRLRRSSSKNNKLPIKIVCGVGVLFLTIALCLFALGGPQKVRTNVAQSKKQQIKRNSQKPQKKISKEENLKKTKPIKKIHKEKSKPKANPKVVKKFKKPYKRKERPKKQYEIPESLEQLLEDKPEDFDFTMACLLISNSSIKETFDRDVDIEKWLHELDTIVAEVQENINDKQTPQQVIKAIAHHLYEVLQFGSSQNGWDHSNLYLSLILEGRQGYCLGFAELWIALAQRLSYKGKELPIYGVSVPQHIFVRWDDGTTRINVETLHVPKYSKDPKKQLLQLLQESDRVEQIPAQNITDEEYIERYGISEEAVKNELFLKNLKPREVLGYIYFNRSSLNGDEVKRLNHSPQRDEMVRRMQRDIRLSFKLHPEDNECLNLLAYSNLYYEGNYKQAIINFEKSLQREKNVTSYVLISRACIGAKQFDKALKYIDKAYNLKKTGETTTDLTLMEAQIYYVSGQYKKGIEFCNSYIKANNTMRGFFDNIFLILSKMQFYTKLGEYDKAYALGQFVLETEIKTYYSYVYPKLGIVLVHMGEIDKANEFFEKSQKMTYQDPEVFYGKGLICVQQKQYKKAQQYFEEALAYYPIDIDAQSGLQSVRKILTENK
ncbi:transglutaminase family protein [Candidatus Uabimicrobium sp. HlEnr_7]|uniref:transglutaminase family protein n=1 Tax=Candidatus Uabimicrobium helgolandensis TaxID=3095367 RepID=UPI003558514F